MEVKELVTKDEIRRLEKAAKDKNKIKLSDWALKFERQIKNEYEKAFKQELDDAVGNFLIAIVYTLHFNEKTKFGNDRITDFMDDLLATIECFKTGEYSPEEYKKILIEQKIHFKEKE